MGRQRASAGGITLSFVAQFLPFQDGESYLTHGGNMQVYTGIPLDLNGNGAGWQQHANVWMLFAGLAAAWLTPFRKHDIWVVWGPWITVAALFFAARDSAPFRTSRGRSLSLRSFAIWGAFRARSARKAEKLAAHTARTSGVQEQEDAS